MNRGEEISANLGQVKEQLSSYVSKAEAGHRVLVCKRNVHVVEMVRVESGETSNRTQLNVLAGSVTVLGDLLAPAIPESDWEMLQ